MQKCYSTDGETFSENFPDDLEAGQVYYEADFKNVTIQDYSKWAMMSLLESLDEYLYMDVGEIADCDFSNVPDEAKKELQNFIESWSEKYVKLSYFVVVGKSVEKIATKDDV